MSFFLQCTNLIPSGLKSCLFIQNVLFFSHFSYTRATREQYEGNTRLIPTRLLPTNVSFFILSYCQNVLMENAVSVRTKLTRKSAKTDKLAVSMPMA